MPASPPRGPTYKITLNLNLNTTCIPTSHPDDPETQTVRTAAAKASSSGSKKSKPASNTPWTHHEATVEYGDSAPWGTADDQKEQWEEDRSDVHLYCDPSSSPSSHPSPTDWLAPRKRSKKDVGTRTTQAGDDVFLSEFKTSDVDQKLEMLHVAFISGRDMVSKQLEAINTRLDKIDTRLGTLESKLDTLGLKVEKGQPTQDWGNQSSGAGEEGQVKWGWDTQ